jgi:hypothetical protein
MIAKTFTPENGAKAFVIMTEPQRRRQSVPASIAA